MSGCGKVLIKQRRPEAGLFLGVAEVGRRQRAGGPSGRVATGASYHPEVKTMGEFGGRRSGEAIEERVASTTDASEGWSLVEVEAAAVGDDGLQADRVSGGFGEPFLIGTRIIAGPAARGEGRLGDGL